MLSSEVCLPWPCRGRRGVVWESRAGSQGPVALSTQPPPTQVPAGDRPCPQLTPGAQRRCAGGTEGVQADTSQTGEEPGA